MSSKAIIVVVHYFDGTNRSSACLSLISSVRRQTEGAAISDDLSDCNFCSLFFAFRFYDQSLVFHFLSSELAKGRQ